MALVDDDEVEEVGVEKLAVMLLIVVAHQLLIQGEVDLVGGDGGAVVLGVVDLMDHLLQRGEVLGDGLVHQVVAVGQVEDLLLHAAHEKAVDNLEGRVGLAGAGGHDEEDAPLPFRDAVEGAVDGDALVIARGVALLAGVIGLGQDRLFFWGEAGLLFIAANELVIGREGVEGDFPLEPGEEVMLGKAVAVGAVGKGQIQHHGIGHGLLQAEGDAVAVVLGLYDGDGVVGAEVEQVIRFLRVAADGDVATEVHLAVGDLDGGLHGDAVLPAAGLDGGGDVIELDVLFGHEGFIDDRSHELGLQVQFAMFSSF